MGTDSAQRLRPALEAITNKYGLGTHAINDEGGLLGNLIISDESVTIEADDEKVIFPRNGGEFTISRIPEVSTSVLTVIIRAL